MYERFFGLADTPFRLTPDPRYLFLSPKHAEALAHLKLGLRESGRADSPVHGPAGNREIFVKLVRGDGSAPRPVSEP